MPEQNRSGYAMFAAVMCVAAIGYLLFLPLARKATDPAALGPNPHVVPRVVEEDPVSSFVREKMKPVSAGFFAPTPLARDNPSEVVLEITSAAVTPSALEAEMRARAGLEGIARGKAIVVAPRMIASLTSDRRCDIVAKDPLDRAISPWGRAHWRWTVTPRVAGPINLTATLTAPVIIDNKETGYVVTSFEETITVQVSIPQRAGDLMKVIKEYWTILGAAGAGVVALRAWRKRKPPVRPGF